MSQPTAWSGGAAGSVRAVRVPRSGMSHEADLEREPDFLTYHRLKAERDAVDRAIASGSYVLEDDPGSGASLLH